MPRDSGGTYTSPISPFVSGTVISSNDVNSRFNGLEVEMTDSLSRSGKESVGVTGQDVDPGDLGCHAQRSSSIRTVWPVAAIVRVASIEA